METRPACPVAHALDLLGGKWKIQLLWQLASAPHRFGALRRAVPGISERMLAQQLRQLTADGFVSRTAFPEVPPRVEYALTPQGRSLVPVLNELAGWAVAHLDGPWASAPASA